MKNFSLKGMVDPTNLSLYFVANIQEKQFNDGQGYDFFMYHSPFNENLDHNQVT